MLYPGIYIHRRASVWGGGCKEKKQKKGAIKKIQKLCKDIDNEHILY
jgi:hypothetical protein